MKTLAAGSYEIEGSDVIRRSTIRKILLVCGILFSLVHIGVDVIAARSYQGYSYTSQAVSELSAIGAPTRSFVVASGFVIIPLLIAFSVGVWLSAGRKGSLRIAAILVATWGIVSLVGSLFSSFFSMHLRGTANLAADAGHLIIASITVLLILLSIGFASSADGRWFRVYSIVLIVAMLGFGALGAPQASAVAAGQQTPWLGLIERVTFYAPGLWTLALAAILLRSQPDDNFSYGY